MGKTRVLVIDDEESMRYFLTRSLARRGYEVEAAATGEEGLSLLEADPPEIVLLDLLLPGLSGLEVLDRIRETRPGTVVLLMTGYGTVDRALDAMRRGAADFVTKPVTGEEIAAKIEEALRARRPPPAAAPAREGIPTPAPPPPPRPLSAFLLETARAEGILGPAPGAGDLTLREAERLFETLYFRELLRRTGGNVSRTARIAGISRPSLHRKIRELDIDVSAFRGS